MLILPSLLRGRKLYRNLLPLLCDIDGLLLPLPFLPHTIQILSDSVQRKFFRCDHVASQTIVVLTTIIRIIIIIIITFDLVPVHL